MRWRRSPRPTGPRSASRTLAPLAATRCSSHTSPSSSCPSARPAIAALLIAAFCSLTLAYSATAFLPRGVALLLLLLPAIQLYALATLDAVIAGLLGVAFAHQLRPARRWQDTVVTGGALLLT